MDKCDLHDFGEGRKREQQADLARRPNEADPNGADPHSGGAKLDAGKVDLTYLLEYWPNALAEVCKVAEFGAKKYSRGGWKLVPDGFARYTKALLRHLFRLASDDGFDHDAQVAWNSLSRLELKLTRGLAASPP